MGNHIKRSGFTLVEAMIALAIIATLITLGYPAMQICNRNATWARMQTLADELARNQIDQIETAAPYDTTHTPAVLTSGTTTTTTPLYVDPATGATVLTATVATTITSTGSNNILAGSVTVTYVYRGKSYTVTMNTMRGTDT